MDTIHKDAFVPDLQVLFEEMIQAGWACQANIGKKRVFRGVRIYRGQQLDSDILYILESKDVVHFPVDTYSFISTTLVSGKADNICCVDRSALEIIEFVQSVYESYHEQENRMNQLINDDFGLNALCELGEELLGNPVFMHDDWFVIIAKSPSCTGLIPKESYHNSALEYLPRQWLEEFKFDSEYQKTYHSTTPSIWDSSSSTRSGRSLYVNIKEGTAYRGRLLAVEQYRRFRSRDFAIIERIKTYAVLIMRCKQFSPYSKLRSMDRLISGLLLGNEMPASDETTFLNALQWNMDDPLVCIRLENQQPSETNLLEHSLHSELFEKLPQSYVLFHDNQQCVIMNLRGNNLSVSMLSHILSPLCRDYCHYAGISSPVRGIRELNVAYSHAGIALQKAFQMRDANWVVSFSSCALEYISTQLKPPVKMRHLVAPQLFMLMDYDRRKDTQYFDTLRVYLVMERDIPKTSEALIIHRTTLLYRLKKIQNLIGVNLEDVNIRLYLLFSLKMMELEKIIPRLK